MPDGNSFDLQSATHIQEKFLITRMCSTVLFSERIYSRLVQALGRCTRGNTDFAAVCVVGDDLMNELITPKKLKQFNRTASRIKIWLRKFQRT